MKALLEVARSAQALVDLMGDMPSHELPVGVYKAWDLLDDAIKELPKDLL